ncbi:MAG: DUF3494 domain-containing protein [Cytophagaceae bacterium]|nr:MAG: DUF3494 domain-containing protein [Cytophagaceae bacterium]
MYKPVKASAVLSASVTFVLSLVGIAAQATPVTLGQAFRFGVLAGSKVANTGQSFVAGDVGITPGTAITGFTPNMIEGAEHTNNTIAQQAQVDLGTAYDVIAGETATQNLTGQNLGNRTLLPGVYHFDTSALLTGSLFLDAMGDSNARFDFQIGSTLTTASSSTVTVINGGTANNVFWQVGSSATLGTGTVFNGNILALTSITLDTDASITSGRALARNGAVTLSSNRISAVVVPESSALALLGGTGLPFLFAILRRRNRPAYVKMVQVNHEEVAKK